MFLPMRAGLYFEISVKDRCHVAMMGMMKLIDIDIVVVVVVVVVVAFARLFLITKMSLY